MPLSFDLLVVEPCIAAFGEQAQGFDLPTYTPADGGIPFPIDGVFDEAYREVDPITGSPVSSTAPMLGVRLAAFPPGVAQAQGDLLTIRGGNYVVREVRVDSHGWARLLLNEAPLP